VSARVTAIPWIKQISVTKSFPHTLNIRVVERAPVAWIAAPTGECSLIVGEGGVVVETNCEGERDLLELVGPSLSGDTPGSRLLDRGLVELIDALRRTSCPGMNITRIDATDPSSIVLEEASGMRILLGSIDSHARRVTALAALSRSIDLDKYAVIDLRLEGEARLVTW
jgi:cell division protein FtsQ